MMTLSAYKLSRLWFVSVLVEIDIFIYKEIIMSKLPSTENTEVFTMRISPKLKDKLNSLAKSEKYGGSASSVIRYLVESASRR